MLNEIILMHFDKMYIEKDSQKMIYYLFLFMIIMKLITGNGIDLKRIKTIQGVINHLKCYSYCQKFIHV